MRHVLVLVAGLSLFNGQAVFAQTQAAASGRITTRMTVTVPNDETELVIEGKSIGGKGSFRAFETPPLEAGTTYRYTLTITWQPNTYTTMTRSRTVLFRPGDRVSVDMTTDDPSDRVRVIYVPTPDDIALEMVELARVGKDDVVFEPGCGDALDIRDLSSANVVLLYMGDHFNMLLRPHLWRQLKVGSRIVSHRFKMGDWEPDKTITVNSNSGGEYELHLWTITEEVKRRLQ